MTRTRLTCRSRTQRLRVLLKHLTKKRPKELSKITNKLVWSKYSKAKSNGLRTESSKESPKSSVVPKKRSRDESLKKKDEKMRKRESEFLSSSDFRISKKRG